MVSYLEVFHNNIENIRHNCLYGWLQVIAVFPFRTRLLTDLPTSTEPKGQGRVVRTVNTGNLRLDESLFWWGKCIISDICIAVVLAIISYSIFMESIIPKLLVDPVRCRQFTGFSVTGMKDTPVLPHRETDVFCRRQKLFWPVLNYDALSSHLYSNSQGSIQC